MARPKNVHLAQELSDDPESFDADRFGEVATAATQAPPAPAAPSAPMTALGDLSLIQALTAALQQGMVGAINQTKPPQREVESEQRSIYNPDGVTKPRPALVCETFIGVINETDASAPPAPAMPYDEDQCKNAEIEALNDLPEGQHVFEMYDGSKEPVHIHVRRDLSTGKPTRRVVAFRKQALSKDRLNLIPNAVALARQLTA